MNAGVINIYQLYEMTEKEISKVEGVGLENAKEIKRVLNDVVEIVEDESELEKVREEYATEFEDEIEGVDTE